MANTVIQLKHSTLTGNVPSSLANGEISINSFDGKFFYSTPAGVVVTHYPYPGPAGLNQEVQFNDSGVLGSDSGLTYNKTTDVLTVVGGAIVGGVNVTPQIQLAFTQANTPSHVANSAASYANSAFIVANNSLGIDTTQNTNITNAGTYANSAFGRANTAAVAANTPSFTANSAASYANSAFLSANNIAGVNLTQNTNITNAGTYANSAFARANNSLDANNGGTVTGTITATSFITTGSFGNILGANTIYANNFVANTGFVQFADGSKQFTANAPSHVSNSAASYANSAFSVANNSLGIDVTQNTNITSTGSYANSAFIHANAAFNTANTAGGASIGDVLALSIALG